MVNWSVVAIPEDNVTYTVGLHYHFGHPEPLFAPKRLTPAVTSKLLPLLNDLGRHEELGQSIQ